MLSFEDVSYRYPGAAAQALTQVSFTVAPGEHVVLLGANGSGKSTLAQLGNGLLLPTQGQVKVNNLATDNRATIRKLRAHIGMVAQNPDNQIVCTTVLDEVAFGPENLGVHPETILINATAALQTLGLAGFEERDPNTLSGGEKQRLIIASLIAMNPTFLLLDEPTSMLDAQGRQEVRQAISRLHQSGHGILHITHDLSFAQTANKVLVLQQGRLVFCGQPNALLSSPQLLVSYGLKTPEDLTHAPLRLNAQLLQTLRQTITINPSNRRGGNRPTLRAQDVCYAYGATNKGQAAAGKKGRRAAGASAAAGRPVVVNVPPPAAPPTAAAALPVLQGINLTVTPGSYTLISGGTGTGKSTLLRVMAGLLQPTAGHMAFTNGDPIMPSDVGIVFQHPETQLFARTVEEEILFGPNNLGLTPTPQSRQEALAHSLEAVGLDRQTFVNRSPFSLSGGEMRRLAIASILAMRPAFLLLDEPTAGLDAQGRAFVHSLITHLVAAGAGVVVVSHDIEEFALRAQARYVLKGGALWPW